MFKTKLRVVFVFFVLLIASALIANHFTGRVFNYYDPIGEVKRIYNSLSSQIATEPLATKQLKNVSSATLQNVSVSADNHLSQANNTRCVDVSLGKVKYKRNGDIFTWTDSDGVPHFSDKKPDFAVATYDTGFIEPLESTGLHLINLGARLLSTHLTQVSVPDAIQESYSELMINAYEDLKQFIVLHYCITDRDDTEFWQAAQRSVEHCPALKRKLAIWKYKICEYADLQTASTSCFNDENYRFILYGMQYYPELHLDVDKAQMETLFDSVKARCQQAVQYSETHQDSLDKLHN